MATYTYDEAYAEIKPIIDEVAIMIGTIPRIVNRTRQEDQSRLREDVSAHMARALGMANTAPRKLQFNPDAPAWNPNNAVALGGKRKNSSYKKYRGGDGENGSISNDEAAQLLGPIAGNVFGNNGTTSGNNYKGTNSEETIIEENNSNPYPLPPLVQGGRRRRVSRKRRVNRKNRSARKNRSSRKVHSARRCMYRKSSRRANRK
jgi:hypothetical protein